MTTTITDMKKKLLISAAVILACVVVWVQEYDPETLPGITKKTVLRVVGHRTVIDSSLPYQSNNVTYASVTRITTSQLVSVKHYENDVLVSQPIPLLEMNPTDTMTWYMDQINTNTGEVNPIPIKPGGAAKFWRAWKKSQPVTIP